MKEMGTPWYIKLFNILRRNKYKRDMCSSLERHAWYELELAGYFDKDSDYDGMLGTAVLELIETFAKQGHNGFSEVIVSNLFNKLSRYEILLPLSGKYWEWNEVGSGVFQNNRCSHVFKDANKFNGQAYDIDGKIFREPGGSTYTSSESCVPITFPYYPKSEIVDVPAQSGEK